MVSRTSLIYLMAAWVLTACISSSSPPTPFPMDKPESSNVPISTPSPAASKALPADTPLPSVNPTPEVQFTKDLPYAFQNRADGSPLLLDVYRPGEGNDYPIVVFLHGLNANKEAHERESMALAERGALVFTINWPTPSSNLAWKNNGEDFRMMNETHLCAFRFARARAAELGGDPSRIVVVGFSMGARIGVTAALAGDDLLRIWDDFAAVRGGPETQIECLEDDASANIQAFVGIGGRYNSINYLLNRDPELWEVANPYAHIGRSPEQRIRLIRGEKDTSVSQDIQVEFNQLLLDAGYDSTLTLWDGTHLVPIDLTVETVFELFEQ